MIKMPLVPQKVYLFPTLFEKFQPRGAGGARLKRRTTRKANKANLDFPNLKTEITFIVVWALRLTFAK